MSWLVTGGAGYIGSHVVRAFQARGHRHRRGRRPLVGPAQLRHRAGTPFVQGTILDGPALEATFGTTTSQGVVHLAGFKYAGVSVQRPLHTYQQNVAGTVDAARRDGGGAASTASCSRRAPPCTARPTSTSSPRTTPKHPESPYGESKLIGEWLLADQGRARPASRTRACATSTSSDRARPRCSTRARTTCSRSCSRRCSTVAPRRINGDDYPTPDGTCVRDYIHVADLADAHVVAAQRLDAGEPHRAASTTWARATASRSARSCARSPRSPASSSRPRSRPRRQGDPARIVASGELAARDLDWRMRHTLSQMVASAWEARRAAPDA